MIKYNPDYLHQEILTSKYNLKVALEHIDDGIQYEVNRLKQESPETNYDSLNDVFELRDSVEKALEIVLEVLETLWKDFQTN